MGGNHIWSSCNILRGNCSKTTLSGEVKLGNDTAY